MQGLIFNAIEEAVVDGHGYAAWDQLLREAGLEGAWTSSGTYPDADVMALVQQAAQTFETSIDQTLVLIGRSVFAPLFARYPGREDITSPVQVLMSLDDVIHVEVRKSYDTATPPRFAVEEAADGSLLVRYASDRHLCWLAVGLIIGCGDAFGRQWKVDHVECAAESADGSVCQMVVRDV